jgi:hypothetical protein
MLMGPIWEFGRDGVGCSNEKEHRDVLKAIRALGSRLPSDFALRNFAQTSYSDSQGKSPSPEERDAAARRGHTQP